MKIFKYFILIMLLLHVGISHSRTIDAQQNGYKLYRSEIIKIIDLADELAGKIIPVPEQWEILDWIVEEFHKNPRYALSKINTMHKMLERIDNAKPVYEHRLAVHSVYYKLHYEWSAFFWNRSGRETLLSIVKTYNPIFEKLERFHIYRPGEKFFVKNKDGYVTKKDGYYLTEFMVDSMVKMTEFLANHRISASDKDKIKKWATKDFEASPKLATKEYAEIINVILPQIYNTHLPKRIYAKSGSQLEVIREKKYRKYYFDVATKNSLNIDYDLIDIVTKHNPVFILNNKYKTVLPMSSLYLRLTKHKFLENVIGVPIKLTEDAYMEEKNILINDFEIRATNSNYVTSVGFGLALRELWGTLSRSQQNSLTRQMKNLYFATGSVNTSLKPMENLAWKNVIAQQRVLLYGGTSFIGQIFNGFHTQHARILNNIANDISKDRSILSLQTGGATIKREIGNYFVVKYDNRPGQEYYVRI